MFIFDQYRRPVSGWLGECELYGGGPGQLQHLRGVPGLSAQGR